MTSNARKYGTTNPVLIESRLNHDPYDEFAWVQDWRFAIADFLHHGLGVTVEDFRPLETPEFNLPYDTITTSEFTYEELTYAYAILTRYREWLRIAGRDY